MLFNESFRYGEAKPDAEFFCRVIGFEDPVKFIFSDTVTCIGHGHTGHAILVGAFYAYLSRIIDRLYCIHNEIDKAQPYVFPVTKDLPCFVTGCFHLDTASNLVFYGNERFVNEVAGRDMFPVQCDRLPKEQKIMYELVYPVDLFYQVVEKFCELFLIRDLLFRNAFLEMPY